MSSIPEHVNQSMAHTEKHYGVLFKEKKDLLKELFIELHKWFDHYDGQKGKDYDYLGSNCIKHRERRHHVEGISEAVKIFTKKYGEEFREIIENEAESHVYDDMECIYFASDYRQIGFWKRVRGF